MNNLGNIKIITFDVFGTLIDWQQYANSFFPGQYADFIEQSNKVQAQGFVTYTEVLRRAYAALRPDSSEGERDGFALNMGKGRPFPDTRTLGEIRKSVKLGAISNCDFRHQIDVQHQLGFVWDTCIVAEDIRDYKPHASAWDKIVDRMTNTHGFSLDEWLHVAAYVDYDLEPAKELGVQTCFMPRPGGSSARDAELLGPTSMVSDLDQLHAGILHALGDPIHYRVAAKFEHPKLARMFTKWMRDEHASDMLTNAKCGEIEVIDFDDGNVEANYIFRNEQSYKEYLETNAEAMREKGKAAFPDHIAAFARSLGRVKLSAEQRKT